MKALYFLGILKKYCYLCNPKKLNRAGVVELVDIPDLGSGAARHGGSSPSARTKINE
jgi:hypothetical protein